VAKSSAGENTTWLLVLHDDTTIERDEVGGGTKSCPVCRDDQQNAGHHVSR
jgi:hypothetical protein